jgi:hypothetical protein
MNPEVPRGPDATKVARCAFFYRIHLGEIVATRIYAIS